SLLFPAVAQAAFRSPLRSCSATPYLDGESWRPGYVKLGEIALALDPLSSSGVEKSMRLALQAVFVANTLLRAPESGALARGFYESCLLESAAHHSVWSRGYYRKAWPGSCAAFWRDRSGDWPPRRAEEPALLARLREACTRREETSPDGGPADGP